MSVRGPRLQSRVWALCLSVLPALAACAVPAPLTRPLAGPDLPVTAEGQLPLPAYARPGTDPPVRLKLEAVSAPAVSESADAEPAGTHPPDTPGPGVGQAGDAILEEWRATDPRLTQDGFVQAPVVGGTDGDFIHRDGRWTRLTGSTYLHSDGTSTVRLGSAYFHSDGRWSRRIGNMVLRSDGSFCRLTPNGWWCRAP